jgi:hypothetical protein
MKFEIMPKTIPSSYDRTSIWIIQAFLAMLVLIALLVQDNYAFIISIGLIFILAICASLILVPFQIQMHGYYELTGIGRVKLMAKSKQQMVLILSSQLEPIVVSVDDVQDLY